MKPRVTKPLPQNKALRVGVSIPKTLNDDIVLAMARDGIAYRHKSRWICQLIQDCGASTPLSIMEPRRVDSKRRPDSLVLDAKSLEIVDENVLRINNEHRQQIANRSNVIRSLIIKNISLKTPVTLKKMPKKSAQQNQLSA